MKLFVSANLKLAGWYLLILMTVSLLFSTIIFQVARSELGDRLHGFVSEQQTSTIDQQPLGSKQLDIATNNLLVSLGYLNLVVLLAGGAGAYLLARWTLKPIERAHESQSQFVSNASHQLRTPLAIMKAETELALSDSHTSNASFRSTLESNLEEINHLTDVSIMLLELSKTESDLQLQSEQFDLVELVNSMVIDRQESKRITVNAPEKLLISLHHVAVQELFSIVIDNALNHSPKNSPILLKLRTSKNQIVCTIANDGHISEQDLSHIFERFYRGSQKSGNYGLGLPLAKQLSKTLGGSISVKNSKKRITFTILLPND